MMRQTVLPFKLDRIDAILTGHGGLALLAEYNHGRDPPPWVVLGTGRQLNHTLPDAVLKSREGYKDGVGGIPQPNRISIRNAC